MAVRTAPQNVTTVRSHQSAVTANDVGMLVLRLGLGIIFFLHGSQKVFGWFGGHPLDQSVAAMAAMHIAAPLAYLSILTEFLGGIALILGVLSRIAGIGLTINMIVAIALVHFKNGFFMMGGPKGPGYEYNIALIAMALAVAIAGPGSISIADWEGRLLGAERPTKYPEG